MQGNVRPAIAANLFFAARWEARNSLARLAKAKILTSRLQRSYTVVPFPLRPTCVYGFGMRDAQVNQYISVPGSSRASLFARAFNRIFSQRAF